MKKLLSLALLFGFLNACQTAPPQPLHLAFFDHTGFTHIQKVCKIYDKNFKEVYAIEGKYCFFENDGSMLVWRPQMLYKYDARMNILWARAYPMHHQLKRSEIDSNFLTLMETYDRRGKVPLIFDAAAVFDQNGNIVKRFNFEPYFKQNHVKYTRWNIKEHLTRYAYDEASHMNSIAELYDEEGEKKILTGYAINDRSNEKIFILDAEMTKVVRVIDATGMAIHDLQQFKKNKLLMYANATGIGANKQPHSSIETYDLITNKFELFYKNESASFDSQACSSVQRIGPDRLFIYHSGCPFLAVYDWKDANVEFVDLKTKDFFVKKLEIRDLGHSSYLINAEGFLKNNIGR